MSDEFIATVVKRTPLGRVGQPEDIALVVAFLASENACWVTGKLIAATGGRTVLNTLGVTPKTVGDRQSSHCAWAHPKARGLVPKGTGPFVLSTFMFGGKWGYTKT